MAPTGTPRRPRAAVGFVGEGGESACSTFKTSITFKRAFKTPTCVKHKQLLRERGVRGRRLRARAGARGPRGSARSRPNKQRGTHRVSSARFRSFTGVRGSYLD